MVSGALLIVGVLALPGGPNRIRMRSRRRVVPDLATAGFSASSVVPADR